MEFGDLLRRILSLNDIKMYNLAAALGYDKSYISKWINHAKLPPSKDIDRLAGDIADFVVRECDSDRKRLTARELGFARRDGSAPEDGVFRTKLAEMLRESYWQSRSRTDRSGRESASGSVPARDRGATGVRRREQNRETECILTTQPVSGGTFRDALDDLSGLDREGSKLRMLALLDMEQFEEHVDLYWKHICRLLSTGANAEVELFEMGARNRVDLPDRLLIARDRFVVRSLDLPFSDRSVPLRIEDPGVVALYYDDARRFLLRQQTVLQSSNVNGNLYYYKYASNTSPKRYLLASMFPIYMSDALFWELLDKYGGPKTGEMSGRNYPREYLKEFSAKKSVVIFESALLRYMSTGRISAFDAYEGEVLTKNERRRHLQGILDELEDGSRLEMKILSDKNPLLNYEESSVSFFSNDSSAYCSDIRKKQDGVRYFMSSDSRRLLNIFLDHIHALPEQHLTGQKAAIDYIYHGMKNL